MTNNSTLHYSIMGKHTTRIEKLSSIWFQNIISHRNSFHWRKNKAIIIVANVSREINEIIEKPFLLLAWSLEEKKKRTDINQVQLPLYVLGCPMLEMGTTTRKPPELILFMDPVLASFDLCKMCMIHITSPNIIPAKRPFDRYFVILWRRNQAK